MSQKVSLFPQKEFTDIFIGAFAISQFSSLSRIVKAMCENMQKCFLKLNERVYRLSS
jgi:hypothetical protein